MYAKLGSYLAATLEATVSNLVVKLLEVLVSCYKPHLQNCLTHLVVQTPFSLVVTVVDLNLGFEMVMC
jgi:hypothetical protein